jgi:hypothetical protein
MTEAHVPPQACGNSGAFIERAQWTVGPGGAQIGRWQDGGLSVYGLCRDCNVLTSDKADPAYVDFHRRVQAVLSPGGGRLSLATGGLPVAVAPGLVSRSVLAGMFAINDSLQDMFPDVALGLRERSETLRLPDELELRLAITVGRESRIGGPVGYMKVLRERIFYLPFADVWFPPLAWSVSSTRDTAVSLGPSLTRDWADVSEWVRYGADLVTDLRNLTRQLPLVRPPRFGAEEWVLLSGNTMTAVEGRSKT